MDTQGNSESIAHLGIKDLTGRVIADPDELFTIAFRGFAAHHERNNTPLGHEEMASVVFPQIAEGDREHMALALLVAIKNGLFRDVSPDKLQNLPPDGLALLVEGGRELSIVIDKAEKDGKLRKVDFRGQEIKVLIIWLHLVEHLLPARNRLVTRLMVAQIFNTGDGRPDLSCGPDLTRLRDITPERSVNRARGTPGRDVIRSSGAAAGKGLTVTYFGHRGRSAEPSAPPLDNLTERERELRRKAWEASKKAGN